ncbi:hypothetical protein LOTGIDRAFT_237946 [Lottia gigantea]|uniref:Uncharacterized protein n=1 Tax=Lottia gigantea TaxID=225164 RepID=V4AEQ8_LOTGI|nr:hypothetical protein LOTGIDRAFT_237946 [Lottia gigantea]ESP02514.1 hypothetical protein LOTGIDRAFT_237946 [Lottia gigantea]
MQELTARCIDYWQTSCAEDRKKAAQLYSGNKKMYIIVMRKMTEIERDLVDLEELRRKCQHKFSEFLTKIFGNHQDQHKMKLNVAPSKSLMGALPECKPREFSVKTSKSSPLPRSPIEDILEESKAYSIKIQDSINQTPVPYTLDQDDIDCLSQKQTSENQPEKSSSSASESLDQKSPGHNTPFNESTEKLSPGIETPGIQSVRRQGSSRNEPRVTVSTVRQKSPVNDSFEKQLPLMQKTQGNDSSENQLPMMQKTQEKGASEIQSSMSPSPVHIPPGFQTMGLSSSISYRLSAYGKQPCESSDIVQEIKPLTDLRTFTISSENTNRTENLNETKQITTNKHVSGKPLEMGGEISKNTKDPEMIRSRKSNPASMSNRIPSLSNDSGFCTFAGPKKDIEEDAPKGHGLENLEEIDSCSIEL